MAARRTIMMLGRIGGFFWRWWPWILRGDSTLRLRLSRRPGREAWWRALGMAVLALLDDSWAYVRKKQRSGVRALPHQPMMATLLFLLPLAAPPKSETELQGTFLLLIVLVAAVGIYLWLILARFSRPP